MRIVHLFLRINVLIYLAHWSKIRLDNASIVTKFFACFALATFLAGLVLQPQWQKHTIRRILSKKVEVLWLYNAGIYNFEEAESLRLCKHELVLRLTYTSKSNIQELFFSRRKFSPYIKKFMTPLHCKLECSKKPFKYDDKLTTTVIVTLIN